jgi:hypothetical protein
MKWLLVLLVCGILLSGCTEQNAEPEQELIEDGPGGAFANYTDGDFSIEYPMWESREASNTSVLSIGNALCVLNVDRYDIPTTSLFNWIVNVTAANENVSLNEVDVEKHSMGFTADFDNITFKAVTKMKYCNHKTYVILATCAEGYYHEYEAELERFSSSADCAMEYEEPDYSQAPAVSNLDDTEFSTFY